MSLMSVTLDVSNDDTSRRASFEQPENMPFIPTAPDASNDDTSREASDEQP